MRRSETLESPEGARVVLRVEETACVVDGLDGAAFVFLARPSIGECGAHLGADRLRFRVRGIQQSTRRRRSAAQSSGPPWRKWPSHPPTPDECSRFAGRRQPAPPDARRSAAAIHRDRDVEDPGCVPLRRAGLQPDSRPYRNWRRPRQASAATHWLRTVSSWYLREARRCRCARVRAGLPRRAGQPRGQIAGCRLPRRLASPTRRLASCAARPRLSDCRSSSACVTTS